jgi:hypothetical protein
MQNPFKKKSIAEIEAHAQVKQRSIDDKFYTDKLDEQRKFFIDKMKKQEMDMQTIFDKRIKDVENKFTIDIIRLKKKLLEYKEQVKRDHKAWIKFKNFIPKALSLSEKLKAVTFAEQQKALDKNRLVEQIENGFEYINIELNKVAPEIESLMKLE